MKQDQAKSKNRKELKISEMLVANKIISKELHSVLKV